MSNKEPKATAAADSAASELVTIEMASKLRGYPIRREFTIDGKTVAFTTGMRDAQPRVQMTRAQWEANRAMMHDIDPALPADVQAILERLSFREVQEGA